MHLKPFRAAFPTTDFITSSDFFFSAVKEDYPKYVKNGNFEKSSQTGFYIYRITNPERTYSGLIASLDIRDYLSGKILTHEKTFPTKEEQQIQLLLKRKAQVKPILLTYPKIAAIDAQLNARIEDQKPIKKIFFEQERQWHEFWQISEEEAIQKIRKLFEKEVPFTYIADGHHRSSATASMHERAKGKNGKKSFDQILCAFFPTTELEIWDFNRVIEGLKELTPTLFMAKMTRLFNIRPLVEPAKPTRKHEITMFLDKEWYQLTWRKQVLKTYDKEPVLLDVTMLNEKVLRDILSVEDVRTDIRVKYIEGPLGLEGLKGKTLKNKHRVGFCLFPVSMRDFIAISDAGNELPPKSTWFEPRIKNGLIVKEF